jgi:excisionase family DNA binding protein
MQMFNAVRTPATPRLITTKALASWLGVSRRTICLWAECSEVPAIRVGNQWRFRAEEIERWVQHRENQSSIQPSNTKVSNMRIRGIHPKDR